VRCACVDIGSNTTRLLVAERENGHLREVLAERVFTRIGAACGADDTIPAEKIDEVAAIVAHQVHLANELGSHAIRVVATAAIRTAPNRDELIAAVAGASGCEMEILAPEEEARLAFHGATRTLEHMPIGEIGVVDVGGGSSELVFGTLVGGVTWSASFRVGSGQLADDYLHSDPPSAAELLKVRNHVAGVLEGLEAPRPRVAYAVGGSAASLRRLVGPELSHETLGKALSVLSTTPAEEVARTFELHAERVRILPAGLLLLQEAAEAFGVPLRIGNGGLREGVVLEELARLTESSQPGI
jgi:exopolyphosphatase/guanosine-5'-triphosphate,3'-diphosphate pyrophosphatase